MNWEEIAATVVVAQKIYIGHGCSIAEIRGDIPIAALAMHIGIERALAALLTSKTLELPITIILKALVVPNLVNKKIIGNRKPP